MPDWIITYSGYILFIITSILAFIKIKVEANSRKKAELELIKFKQEFDEKLVLREKRYQTYKEYLSKLDSINTGLYSQQFSEEMVDEINDAYDSIVKDPTDLSKYLEVMKKQSKFLLQWMRQQNTLLDEFNSFRLICSDEILSLINEYTALAREALEESATLSSNILTSAPGQFNKDEIKKYSEKYDRLRIIKENIEQLMRKDLGVN